MGKRDDKRREKMVNEVFSKVQTVSIPTEFGVLEIISIEEMPMSQMKEFMMVPPDLKMAVMMDLMKICLVDPNKWEMIEIMPIKQVNRIIKLWMRSGAPMDFEDDEDDE